VDDGDYDLVMQYWWCARAKARPSRTVTYATTRISQGGERIEKGMHTLLTGWAIADHVDHDGLNNQRSNLREATSQQNRFNSRPGPGSSRFKGVHWAKQNQRWNARIHTRGVIYGLGSYENEIDAALAYDTAARELFGEFAYLNFPDIINDIIGKGRGRGRRYPQVQDADIVGLRARGMTWWAIAAEVGMSRSGVRMRWQRGTGRGAAGWGTGEDDR
jgi:hypothetical protein